MAGKKMVRVASQTGAVAAGVVILVAVLSCLWIGWGCFVCLPMRQEKMDALSESLECKDAE